MIFTHLAISTKAFKDVIGIHAVRVAETDAFTVNLVYSYAEHKEIPLTFDLPDGGTQRWSFKLHELQALVKFWVRRSRQWLPPSLVLIESSKSG